jgi:hypothetical protein
MHAQQAYQAPEQGPDPCGMQPPVKCAGPVDIKSKEDRPQYASDQNSQSGAAQSSCDESSENASGNRTTKNANETNKHRSGQAAQASRDQANIKDG